MGLLETSLTAQCVRERFLATQRGRAPHATPSASAAPPDYGFLEAGFSVCLKLLYIMRDSVSGSCDASTHCPSEFQVDLPNKVTIKAKAFKAIVN